jgi:serpin B
MQPLQIHGKSTARRREFLKASSTLGAFLLTGFRFYGAQAEGVPASQEHALTAAFAAMGGDLYAALAQKPGNLVLSPYSIGSAMAMTASGARGSTEAEFQKVLHLPLARSGMQEASNNVMAALRRYDLTSNPHFCPPGSLWTGSRCEGEPSEGDQCRHPLQREAGRCTGNPALPFVQVSIANALMLSKWGSLVSEAYRALAQSAYEAELFANASLDTVNGWVKKKTNGKIEKILDNLGREPGLVLLNAIYFRAAWKTPFAVQATQDQGFHLSHGALVKVPAMFRTGDFRLLAGPGFRALALPYAQEALSMTVVLPEDIGGLPAVAHSLLGDGITRLLGRVETQPLKRVALTLPRFKASVDEDLARPFEALGLKLAFSRNADFGGMLGEHAQQERLHIEQIRHRALIEVREEGTEAAAATAVAVVRSMTLAQSEPEPFAVNRPFLFFISDAATGTVLFQGRIADPSQTA